MIEFEDPIEFRLKKSLNNVNVTYSNLIEICQGGPAIGELYINGDLVKGYNFGGPCLIEGNFVCVPVFVSKLFKRGFKIARIHASTLDISIIGERKDLIFLDKIENGKIYFFENINKTIYRNCSI